MPRYFYQNSEVEVIKFTSGGLAQLATKQWINASQLQERKDPPPVVEKNKKTKTPAQAEEVKNVVIPE